MKRYTFLLIGVLLALVALVGGAAAEPAAPQVTLTGTLTVVVGDPQPVEGQAMTPATTLFTLHLPDGRDLLLSGTAEEYEILQLNRQQVTVTLPAAEAEAALTAGDARAAVAVGSIGLAPGAVEVSTTVSGNTRWITIACKFADVVDEPRSVSFFRQMYQNVYPGLDHYWRQVSYDNINLLGSDAAGWFQLPNNRDTYVPGGVYADLGKLFNECTAAADSAVYFPDYDGINLVFNDRIGAYAWGGNWWGTMDGVSKTYRSTWLPPQGYLSMGLVQHEMGHSYGMPHSGSSAGDLYFNDWDVMGRPGVIDCHEHPGADPVFGCIERNPIAYHREIPGWLGERVYVAGPGIHSVRLTSATQPAADGYLMVRIPIDDEGFRFYTVEARQRRVYDEDLPGNAIIIHEVDRRREAPAWIVEPCPPEYPMGCPGSTDRAMLHEGETMALGLANAAVRVYAKGNNGYDLTVVNGAEARHVELTPVADAYVKSSAGNRNFGGAADLLVGQNGTISTYLDFGPLPEAVLAARLRLTAAAPLRPEPADHLSASDGYFKGTTTLWTESSVTYNNAPEAEDGGWALPYTLASADVVEWDLWWTQYWGTPYHTLIVWNVWQNVATNRYSSREGVNPPRLILDYVVMPPDEPDEETHTYAPTNDAHVMQAKPNAIYGAKPTLQVKDAAKDVNSYVKFNVNGLSGAVQSATLRLWVKEPSPDGGAVYAVSQYYKNTTTQWLETGLKWNNAPVISGAPLDTVGPAVGGQWVELDVTSAVLAALGSDGRVSLALSNDSSNPVSYGSKEGPHPPELVVITN